MSFWSKVSPKRAAKDFAGEWTQSSPHRWPVLGLAMAITFTMFWTLIPEDQRGPFHRPDVIFITSWAEDRTDEEIIASNIANQERKDARAARRAEREEFRKDMYRTLGRATGVDVDAMEAKINAEEAADAAEAEADAALTDAPLADAPVADAPLADSGQTEADLAGADQAASAQ